MNPAKLWTTGQLWLLTMSLTFGAVAPSLAAGADLAYEQRLACQRAIEEVSWAHRVWPASNPGSKPPFSAVAPASVVRAKVDDALLKSTALETLWERPLTGSQLRAEIEQMARNTRQPDRLRDLWNALGNDPIAIGECLARPLLADRLARSWYAFDRRFHGDLETQALDDLKRFATAEWMRLMSGEYGESVWVKGSEASATADETLLTEAEWTEAVARLRTALGGSASSGELPLRTVGPLREDRDRFYVVAVLDDQFDRLRVATVEWAKVPFAGWWAEASRSIAPDLTVVADNLPLPTIGEGCADDSWAPMRHLPANRAGHDAVWTGSEMIVWGNRDVFGAAEPGARYDPVTDTWRPITTTGHPDGNMVSTAVWTGTDMIVWGGFNGSGSPTPVDTGARYDPVADRWTPTSTAGSPSPRGIHTAVWTGSEMVVWGGCGDTTNCADYLDTGGRYDPETDSWTPTSDVAAPSPRHFHSGTWTGSEMVIWAGQGPGVFNILNDGARYDPLTDAWTAMTNVAAPDARVFHTAVSTGDALLVFGGCPTQNCIQQLSGGASYDPAADSWSQISSTSEPSERYNHSAIWTGDEMIVHGGCLGDECSSQAATGGRYHPPTDSWTATSTVGAPLRASHTAVWTGSEMIVWAGCSSGECQSESPTGARYDPSTDSWIPTSIETGPSARINHAAVWTGAEMILWGGAGASNDGDRYDPATNHWTPINPVGGRGRDRPTAVWTGAEMLVWGGSQAGVGGSNTGERYDVVGDSWTAMSTTSAPEARLNHAGVWTGTEMIVWGGCPGGVCLSPYLSSGGRYDPATDSWTATSTAGAPAGRIGTSSATEPIAVWTGDEMIVWGGSLSSGATTNTGGRYSPLSNSWTPTRLAGAPAAREHHTLEWTGEEMIVWGGEDGTLSFNDGASYSPTSDSWTPVSDIAAPSARYRHGAVWTGSEMVVWGGNDNAEVELSTGGRYDPASDSWSPTNSTGPFVPFERTLHTTVWSGDQMLIWGGRWNGAGQTDTGAGYCAVPAAGIPCADLTSFRARCTADGKLQARILLSDASHNGQTLTLDVDGQQFVRTITNGRATLSMSNQGGTGRRTITLVDPAGCFAPKNVTCN